MNRVLVEHSMEHSLQGRFWGASYISGMLSGKPQILTAKQVQNNCKTPREIFLPYFSPKSNFAWHLKAFIMFFYNLCSVLSPPYPPLEQCTASLLQELAPLAENPCPPKASEPVLSGLGWCMSVRWHCSLYGFQTAMCFLTAQVD